MWQIGLSFSVPHSLSSHDLEVFESEASILPRPVDVGLGLGHASFSWPMECDQK